MDLVPYECPFSQHCLLKGAVFSHCVFSRLSEFPSRSSRLLGPTVILLSIWLYSTIHCDTPSIVLSIRSALRSLVLMNDFECLM